MGGNSKCRGERTASTKVESCEHAWLCLGNSIWQEGSSRSVGNCHWVTVGHRLGSACNSNIWLGIFDFHRYNSLLKWYTQVLFSSSSWCILHALLLHHESYFNPFLWWWTKQGPFCLIPGRVYLFSRFLPIQQFPWILDMWFSYQRVNSMKAGVFIFLNA